jgi:RHS repeat-associated protein
LLEINNLCASYYPFGSTQDGLNYVSTTLSDNDLKNKYLFGGQEQDSKTGFFEYHYRQYDSWLGRWHVQDPLMEFYATQSPYHFAGNNPVNNYEANGAYYYMSPFDSKNYGDDDDGFSFDIGDGFGSDGGGGRDGLSGGGDEEVGYTFEGMNVLGETSATSSYRSNVYFLFPSRMPWLNYSPSRNDLPENGWMPKDQAGGGKDYKMDKKGNIIFVKNNNSDHDRLYKAKGNGEIRPMQVIDNIAIGILSDGDNFKTTDKIIDLDGENPLSLPDVEDFLTKFANFIGLEMSGAYLSTKDDADADISHVYIDEYGDKNPKYRNTPFEAFTSLKEMYKYPGYFLITHFHTHLSNLADRPRTDVENPSGMADGNKDIGFRNSQIRKGKEGYFYNFLILTRTVGNPPIKQIPY